MKNKDWLLNNIVESKIQIKELTDKLDKIENDYWEMKYENDKLEITIKSLQRELEGKNLMDIKL
jgi:hypothetical protein